MMEVKKAIDFIVKKLRKELPEDLTYHSVDHTVGVIDNAITIGRAEGLDDKEMELLTVAAAFHDSGFLLDYENHEENGCRLIEKYAPEFGMDQSEVEIVQSMIMSTKIPQNPESKLEKILCDADLFYLGGKRYEEISQSLYEELKAHGIQMNNDKWVETQINFLSAHEYWTDYSKAQREAGKQKVLRDLRNLVSSGA